MELTDADRAAGVVSDEVVLFGRSKAQTTPDHAVRIVTVKATPHRSGGKTGGGSTGPNCDGFLRIATNRLDLPAELIGEIYRLRWMIETFFRMFKQLLGCRHLLSTKPYGVEIQVYCGIIACLLIMLYTGRKPQPANQCGPSAPAASTPGQVKNLPPRCRARIVPNTTAPVPIYRRMVTGWEAVRISGRDWIRI